MSLWRFLPWYCPDDIEKQNRRTLEVVEQARAATAKATDLSNRIADSYRKADERLYRR